MFKSITRAQLKDIFICYGFAYVNDHLDSRGVKINLRKSESAYQLVSLIKLSLRLR